MKREDEVVRAIMRHHDSLVYTVENLIKVAKRHGVDESMLTQAERILQNVKEDTYGSNSRGNQPPTV